MTIQNRILSTVVIYIQTGERPVHFAGLGEGHQPGCQSGAGGGSDGHLLPPVLLLLEQGPHQGDSCHGQGLLEDTLNIPHLHVCLNVISIDSIISSYVQTLNISLNYY